MQTSEELKERAIRILYTWKLSLRHLEKIKQVYDLLKEQGVVEEDPQVDEVLQVPRPPPKMAEFEDEEKARLLDELLKSKKPEDLQAANRLIKGMVRAQEQKIEKTQKQKEVMESAETKAKLLDDLITQPQSDQAVVELFGGQAPQPETRDYALMKELYDSLVELRQTLFRLAAEAAETNEENLDEILAVNDQVNRAVQLYKEHNIDAMVASTTTNATQQPTSPSVSFTPVIAPEVDLFTVQEDQPGSPSSNADDVAILSMSRNGSPAVPRKPTPSCNANFFVTENFDKFLTKNSEPMPTTETAGQGTTDDLGDLSGLQLTPKPVQLPKLNKPKFSLNKTQLRTAICRYAKGQEEEERMASEKPAATQKADHSVQFLVDDISVNLTDLDI
ncbi:ADP-ribosylation factor-binding protein GGA3, partial [Aphelenchoides avenae]